MLIAIEYNSSLESLGDILPEDFVTAFENEIRSHPEYVNLEIEVTFNDGETGITSFTSDDFDADVVHDEELRDRFYHLAEKAFNVCCRKQDGVKS